MKYYAVIYLLFLSGCSCKNNFQEKHEASEIAVIIADTTGNRAATGDHLTFIHNNKVSQQINLREISKGADSIELRLWKYESFFSRDELYIFKLKDSLWHISHSLIYLRDQDYDKPYNKKWDPFTQPIVDSASAQSICISDREWKDSFPEFKIDSIWLLPSQSEINMPPELGFLDGVSYCLEIADKKRYKLIKYGNPDYFFDKMGDSNHSKFLDVMNTLIVAGFLYGAVRR
ncbi:MAG: hypothetical protein SFU87_13725 [Chitinophagaceae bacterium]|nr:hypothetical protein [Chitinophagaceae bacterium]